MKDRLEESMDSYPAYFILNRSGLVEATSAINSISSA